MSEQAQMPILPLPQRLKGLVSDIQFVWWVAHVITLYNGLKYYLYLIEISPQSTWSYYLVFLSSIITSGLILFKAGQVDEKLSQSLQRAFFSETGSYLALSLMWILYSPLFTAPLPFILYSAIHVVNYLRSNILFCLSPEANEEFEKIKKDTTLKPVLIATMVSLSLRDFIYRIYGLNSWFIANFEILAITPTIFIFSLYNKTLIPLTIYLLFLFQRAKNSAITRKVFSQYGSVADDVILKDGQNESLKASYRAFKSFINYIYPAHSDVAQK